MEIFYQTFQCSPSNLSDIVDLFYFYNLCNDFCSWMFKIEVTDRYMHCIMQIFFLNAQVCMHSVADLNIGHCVELTFFNNKLAGFLVIWV